MGRFCRLLPDKFQIYHRQLYLFGRQPVQGMPELNRFEKNTLINNGTAPPPHPLSFAAADVTYILIDDFANGEYSGPYQSNVVCGSGNAGFDYTTGGLSVDFRMLFREKC